MMPARIARYRVEGCLGRGGMGEVWKAWDETLGRWVAIKSLLPGLLSAERRDALRREARAVAALSHPAIAQIFDLVSEDGRDYLVFELVEGDNLAAVMRDGRLPASRALRLAIDVAEGLGAAHARGLVHRDLKPENVVVNPDGRAKVLDFGLARLAAVEHGRDGEASFGGTLSAMSPEQVERRAIDHRSDLFSFGSLLYEMLTGRHPFKAGFPVETMHRISHARPPRVDEVDRALPAELGDLVERLLAKQPDARPQAADEVVTTLARLLGRLEMSGEVAALKRVRRRRAVLGAAAAAVLLAATVGALWLREASRPDPLYVAVLEPTVEGEDPSGLLASAVRLATMNALAGLEEVYVLGTAEVDAVEGSPAKVAAAVGAHDLLTTRLVRAGPSVRVELSRREGDEGHIVWTEAFAAPPDDYQLLADTISAYLRRAYKERPRREGAFGVTATPEAYREYLELRQEVHHPTPDLYWPDILARLSEVRSRAPSLLNAHLMEASISRYLFESTFDTAYLKRADAVVAEAMRTAPEDPRPLITALEIALAASRFEEAESLVARLAEVDPGNPEVLLQRAELAERRGDIAAAVQLLETSLTIRQSWRTLLVLAKAEVARGKFDDARTYLSQALELAPENIFVRAELAQMEMNYGDPGRAENLYLELVAESPQPVFLVNLASTQMLLGRYSDAAERLESALAAGNRRPSVFVNLADCYGQLGEEESARALYRRAVEVVDEYGEPNALSLGFGAQARVRLGDVARGLQDIERALELAPDDATIAYHAAFVFALAGDADRSALHVQRALDLGLDSRWFASPLFHGASPTDAPRPTTSSRSVGDRIKPGVDTEERPVDRQQLR